MQNLDPTYLRYIYDGLLNGSVHADNASELPDGLIGLYEEAFEEHLPILQRQKLLERFALFALLKKEVSVAFVAEVLGESEQEISEFINTDASWFNSPEPGKFQLYHERLKVYVMQKLSEKEMQSIHEKLITRLEKAIEEQKADEFERYALEFLSEHLTVEAFKDESKGKKLLDFTKNEILWDRQIRISNKFDWSRKGLNHAALWTSKYDQEENIDCYLDLVQLHNKEQNDAENIVRLVANNEINLALERITAFGGPSKEEKERQFILFMLCLMELTLLESKTQPWRKKAIEKLLKHLEQEIPVNHSLVNWGEFFSSYTMFLMACDWVVLGLDYLMVYKLTNDWESDWVLEKGPYTNSEFDVLYECSMVINDVTGNKSIALRCISISLAKQGKVDEALACARGISDDEDKISTLKFVSAEVFEKGDNKVANTIIKEVLNYARSKLNDRAKSKALSNLSTELLKQGLLEEAASAMQGAIICARGINNLGMDWAFIYVSTELAKQGKVKEAFFHAQYCINDESLKSSALKIISTELVTQGKVKEALNFARRIVINDIVKSKALSNISTEYFKQGLLEEAESALQEALNCTREISDYETKSKALSNISTEHFKQSKLEGANIVMQEALKYGQSISNDTDKAAVMNEITTELAKQGKLEEALFYVQYCINDESLKSRALKDISTELTIQGKTEEANSVIKEAINYGLSISSFYYKSILLKEIFLELEKWGRLKELSSAMKVALTYKLGFRKDSDKFSFISYVALKLAKQGKIDKAFTCASGISNDIYKSGLLRDISTELAKQGKVDEALSYARGISNDDCKSIALKDISTELAKNGKVDEALACARGINNDYYKSRALKDISTELTIQGKVKEALNYSQSIVNESEKSKALTYIFIELDKNGMLDEAASAKQQALSCARGIIDDFSKGSALENISTELAKYGKTEDAISFARYINDGWCKSSALKNISIELAKNGKLEEAASTIQEALVCARGINDDCDKSSVLWEISTELANQSKIEEANFVLHEALACARGINDDDCNKSEVLRFISTELAKQGNLPFAEIISLEIHEKTKKQSCWESIAKSVVAENGWQKAMQKVNQFQNNDTRFFYLKGWAEEIIVVTYNDQLLIQALPLLKNDIVSIANLLQKNALNGLFFGNASIQKLQKFNRVLNLQWAMDLKKELDQIPN